MDFHRLGYRILDLDYLGLLNPGVSLQNDTKVYRLWLSYSLDRNSQDRERHQEINLPTWILLSTTEHFLAIGMSMHLVQGYPTMVQVHFDHACYTLSVDFLVHLVRTNQVRVPLKASFLYISLQMDTKVAFLLQCCMLVRSSLGQDFRLLVKLVNVIS